MWCKSINFCRGSSATVHLPRTQMKELRVCCHFQFLWGSGSPGGCLLGASRNSKEDLQIWTLALSERNGRKFTFVNPLHCFWMYSQALRWISCSASGCCFCTSRVLSRHSARKQLETLPPCIPSWGKISLKCGETAQRGTRSNDLGNLWALIQRVFTKSHVVLPPPLNCCSAPDWAEGLHSSQLFYYHYFPF